MSQRLELVLRPVEHLLAAIELAQVGGDGERRGPAGRAMVLDAAARLVSDDDTITVCAPALAKSTAISRPMPRLPPVMTTTFP